MFGNDRAALVNTIMAQNVESVILESLSGASKEVELSVVVDLAHDAVSDLLFFFHDLRRHGSDML